MIGVEYYVSEYREEKGGNNKNKESGEERNRGKGEENKTKMGNVIPMA